MSFLHGQFDVSTEENIILVKLVGSFNREGTCAYISRVKDVIQGFNGEPFAMMINDLELEGGTPEAYEALNEYNQWLNALPIIAKAFVIDNDAKKHIILANAPAITHQNIAFFKTQEDAISWLKEKVNTCSASANG